jgi:hypothetical protein
MSQEKTAEPSVFEPQGHSVFENGGWADYVSPNMLAAAKSPSGIALGASGLGAMLGATGAPSGRRGEGLARGAFTGAGTGLGGLAGYAAGNLAADKLELGNHTGTAAAVLAALAGGYGGNRLASTLAGRPSWDRDKRAGDAAQGKKEETKGSAAYQELANKVRQKYPTTKVSSTMRVTKQAVIREMANYIVGLTDQVHSGTKTAAMSQFMKLAQALCETGDLAMAIAKTYPEKSESWRCKWGTHLIKRFCKKRAKMVERRLTNNKAAAQTTN